MISKVSLRKGHANKTKAKKKAAQRRMKAVLGGGNSMRKATMEKVIIVKIHDMPGMIKGSLYSSPVTQVQLVRGCSSHPGGGHRGCCYA